MDFEIIVSQIFINSPEKKYINACCVGCDEVLYKLKNELASAMNVESDNLKIYQEDWGWALEFSKNEFSYFVGVGNLLETNKTQTTFSVGINARRKVKKLFFSRMIEDENESQRFSKILKNCAAKSGFTTS